MKVHDFKGSFKKEKEYAGRREMTEKELVQ